MQQSRSFKSQARPQATQRPPLPPLNFPEQLPVSGKRDEIARAIRDNRVVIVCGETGSGKTTQLPKIAWEAGRGRNGLIGHTQPRRLAATSVAKRIAQELQSSPGQYVGYKIRFNEQITPGATIKLMTDGVLLAETLSDPHLNAYDTLIVDEAHERSLNIDFLLGYLKQLLDGPRRDTLKLIITSATIDAQRFAQHFGDLDKPAPVIEVSGRLFPVEIRYQALNLPSKKGLGGPIKASNPTEEPDAENDEVEQTLPSAIADAATELWREGPGDILVFLPGEREIRDAMEYLRKWSLKSAGSGSRPGNRVVSSVPPLEVLALFSRLSAADQERVFSQSKGRRIVLATNVAETSLTVPGVRYVIDAGLARMKRYRYRTKVEQLQVENISQAAANQRSGRCGRVANGICIRLYGEDDFLKRPRFTDPEVLRSSLAAVILRMKALRLTDIEEFPFLDLPPRRAILDGYALLQELQAIDETRAVTVIGRQLAKLPLDPRIARMLLAAHEQHCLNDVLIIASGLSVQDPRERPMEAAQAADLKHVRFADEKSDFIALLKVWRYWRNGEGNKESSRIFQEQLKREFISPRRLREWADVHSQLREAVQELGWIDGAKPTKAEPSKNEPSQKAADGVQSAPWDKALDAIQYEKIHRSLLAGLLGNLGLKGHESNVYLGTHEIKFQIHPGSGLAKKGGRWIMASELVDTHKLYARNVAQVQPEWIEAAAGHLIRRSCSDARWEKKAAQVMAVERGVLYGLPVYAQRRVHFGPINPELSRELMIRGALVDLDWESDLAFFKHNQRLIADIESLEHKIRRPDLLVDEQLLYAFFDASVPEDIVSGQTLTFWWRKAGDPNLLKLSREALMRKDVAGISSDSFPRTLQVKGNDLLLDYHFEPSSVRDGVSVTVPLHLLNQVDANRCEWLVPGMLKDKVLALIKSLPPKLRHRLQPFDVFVSNFIAQHDEFLKGIDQASDVRSLTDAIRDAVKDAIRLPVLPTDFRTETLASHAWMRFIVIDEHQRELAASRDLSALKAQLGSQAQSQFRAQLILAQLRASAQIDPTLPPALAPKSVKTLSALSGTVAATPSTQNLSTNTVYTDWSFGQLEELIETRGSKGERLIGYPGLVTQAAGVTLQVFDDPDQARKEHLKGLRRLFALQFREQIKFFDRHVPNLRDMTIQFLPLGSADELKQQLVDIVLDRICLVEPLPVDCASFVARCEQSRGRIGLLAQEVGRLAGTVLTEYAAVQKKLVAIKAQAIAYSDIDSAIKRLCHKRFLIDTPWANLSHLPRYLKAAQLRIDKLRADPNRDAVQMGSLNPLQSQWLRAQANQRGTPHPRLEEYRWLLEELRVSLFAQELKTPVPVSAKRLEKVWQSLQN